MGVTGAQVHPQVPTPTCLPPSASQTQVRALTHAQLHTRIGHTRPVHIQIHGHTCVCVLTSMQTHSTPRVCTHGHTHTHTTSRVSTGALVHAWTQRQAGRHGPTVMPDTGMRRSLVYSSGPTFTNTQNPILSLGFCFPAQGLSCSCSEMGVTLGLPLPQRTEAHYGPAAQREPCGHVNLCVPKHTLPIWADHTAAHLLPRSPTCPRACARTHPSLKATVPPYAQAAAPTAPTLQQSKQEARRLSVEDPLSPSLPQERPEKEDKGIGRLEKGQGW